MQRQLAIILLAAMLSGCAQLQILKELYSSAEELITGSDNAEPPKELAEEFEPKDRMTVVWRTKVGKGYEGQVLNLLPAVTESTVYAADRKGEVVSINRVTGDEVWSVETALELSAGPVIVGDKLLFGTRNAELVALNLADGGLLWKTALSSEILALPKARRNMIIVRTSDGRVFGVEQVSGAIHWNHERSIPALSVRGLGTPGLTDDLVLDGFGSTKLVALGLVDGKIAWESTVAVPHGRSEVERLVELNAEPLIKDDLVYVTGFQAGISAVSLKDGEVLWRQAQVYSSQGLVSNRRSLFLTDASSDVWQLDITNGADLWKQGDLHQRRLTMPALIRNRLIVGDYEGYLHALSIDDGSLTGRLEVDSKPILATPVVYKDMLYIYTTGGVLAAVSID